MDGVDPKWEALQFKRSHSKRAKNGGIYLYPQNLETDAILGYIENIRSVRVGK